MVLRTTIMHRTTSMHADAFAFDFSPCAVGRFSVAKAAVVMSEDPEATRDPDPAL